MRIRVRVSPIKTDITYNEYLQALIYRSIGSKKLHDTGYVYKKRRYKPFVFSRLMGSYKLNRGKIFFKKGADLEIGVAVPKITEKIVNSLLVGKNRLGRSRFDVEEIEVVKDPEFVDGVVFKTISPVTVHKTRNIGGRGIQEYVNPNRKEHSVLLRENIVNKHRAIHGKKYSIKDINIKPLGLFKQEVIKYKGCTIEGYMGKYFLDGEPDLIKTAYNCGLGVKNAQGFGCLEVV